MLTFSKHLNQIQSPWRWRHQVHPKYQHKLILQSVRTHKTITWTTSTMKTWTHTTYLWSKGLKPFSYFTATITFTGEIYFDKCVWQIMYTSTVTTSVIEEMTVLKSKFTCKFGYNFNLNYSKMQITFNCFCFSSLLSMTAAIPPLPTHSSRVI